MQEVFTKDEFDDIMTIDAAVFPGNAQSYHHAHVNLNHMTAQYTNGQNQLQSNFCGASLASSDGTDYKTGELNGFRNLKGKFN